MSKAVRANTTTSRMDPNNSGEEDSKKNLQVGLFFSLGKELECALMYNILQYLDLRSIQNVHSSLIKPLNKYYETEDFEKVVGLDDILKVALIYKKYSLTCPKGTPIVCACEKGNFDDVKFLWKGRRQISNDNDWISEVGTSSTGEEMTPLMAAVSKGNFKIADFLFHVCEVNVNISNKEGYNAFHSVISYIMNHLPNQTMDKDCILFVCWLLSRMSVSNLKSENDELDATKLINLNRKLSRRNWNMYTYMSCLLSTKLFYINYDSEGLIEYFGYIPPVCEYEFLVFDELYIWMDRTTSDLYDEYCYEIDHDNDEFHTNETPMELSEFILDRGLPDCDRKVVFYFNIFENDFQSMLDTVVQGIL